MARPISTCWRPLLLGLLGLGLLALIPSCANSSIRGSAAFLRAEAEAHGAQALKAGGFDWARLEVGEDGRARLIGLPPSPEAGAAALAALGVALKDQVGLPGVIAQITPNAVAQADAGGRTGQAPPQAEPVQEPPKAAPPAPPARAPSDTDQADAIGRVAPNAGLQRAGPRTCQTSLRQALASDPIRFASGSAVVAGVGRANFDRLAAVVNACDRHRLLVAGHTDPRGGASANQRLSLARARAVRALLIEAGAEPGRLRAVGFGESRLIDPRRSAAAFARNRRIEIVVNAR
jgi:outer membrane protein OmpA-like peptidoglycan-associated protein